MGFIEKSNFNDPCKQKWEEYFLVIFATITIISYKIKLKITLKTLNTLALGFLSYQTPFQNLPSTHLLVTTKLLALWSKHPLKILSLNLSTLFLDFSPCKIPSLTKLICLIFTTYNLLIHTCIIEPTASLWKTHG